MLPCLLVLCLALALCAGSIFPSRPFMVADSRRRRREQLINFFAGGAAGTISSCLTIPLEVVKTQLQSSVTSKGTTAAQICRRIWQQEGVKGFFRGLQPLLVGIIPTRAIYFWAYSSSKERLGKTSLGDSAGNHLLSAFCAGITSNTLMNPLWMVRTRFQLLGDQALGQRAFKSYGEVVRSIWAEEGAGGFFKGLTASYVGCFEGAIHWIVYEKLKTRLSTEGQAPPSAGQLFFSAGLSKFTAICLTYPHEVVRTRLREQAVSGVFKYRGFFQTLGRIGREEGVRGLYGGLGMHLARSVPNAAVMFASYELVSAWLKKRQLSEGQ